MPPRQFDRDKAVRDITEVERALKEGYPPPGGTKIGSHQKTAIRVAAERIGDNPSELRRRTGDLSLKGSYESHYGLKPDWGLYVPPPPASPPEPEPVKEPEPPADPLDQARQRLKDRDLAADNRKLMESLIEAQDLRAGVLKLLDPPLSPRIELPNPSASKGARTVIIHLSDWHVGEFVNIDEMGGVNSFSIDIFKARAGRLCAAAKALLTTHWKGEPPEKIILIFGGDMITGEIHDELRATNDALSAPAVRICAETLAGLVKELRTIAPIDIYSLPGNHGRLTKKPEAKGMAVNSFDTLITNVVEMMMQATGLEQIRFFYPKSGDALFNVYRWIFCAVHGDRIGSKGGQGFLGALATVIRGIAKMRAYYTGQGVIVDYFLTAHMHTTAKLPRGFANGSLIGPSEYSRDLRADPEPSKQNLIVIHSERGVISFEELYCGSEEEGTIYQARAA